MEATVRVLVYEYLVLILVVVSQYNKTLIHVTLNLFRLNDP